jgi:hypothetical protein
VDVRDVDVRAMAVMPVMAVVTVVEVRAMAVMPVMAVVTVVNVPAVPAISLLSLQGDLGIRCFGNCVGCGNVGNFSLQGNLGIRCVGNCVGCSHVGNNLLLRDRQSVQQAHCVPDKEQRDDLRRHHHKLLKR